ncbi:MAG: RNA-processing protein [Candidatus Hecatellales archaeon]|nr:MAG: RNA-processing protein [Candidatus Hecatellales archaeon]
MSQIFRVRIPVERVGVLIGREGNIKKKIESMCKVKLEVNSETGEVDIAPTKEMDDPTLIFKAQNIVLAIGRGFSPEKAFKLIDDDYFLHIINLRDVIGRSKRDLKRIKGRVIGKEGKTRRIIEETTNVDVSIYGHTIALIGRIEELTIAKEAIEKLVSGSQHKTVYKFLGRKRSELKKARFELWEKPL